MLALDQTAHLVPDGMTFEDAAALTINYQTAYFALVHRARLRRGETVLVHGGAGGVGTATIQIAKSLGATVIATAGSDEKTAVCRACGADHAVNYAGVDFSAVVKELTGGHGADLIVDPVGGDVFDRSVKCIAFEGRIVVIGFAGGRIAELATNRVLLKNMSVIGLFWGNYQTRNETLVRDTQEVLYDMYRRGTIKPVIYQRYPLERLPDALEAIESRRCHGKPVVVV
jgi:NADPH2:quinone reductase